MTSDSHDSKGTYGFHAGVSPEEAHKMAEIANQNVVEQNMSKEKAEDKWIQYKNVADTEAGQLEEVYVESICCKFECEPPFQKLEELQLPPATKEER